MTHNIIRYPVVADVPVVVRCVRCVGFAIRHLLLSGFVIRFDFIIHTFMTTTPNKVTLVNVVYIYLT